jgi:hypothetical protein
VATTAPSTRYRVYEPAAQPVQLSFVADRPRAVTTAGG